MAEFMNIDIPPTASNSDEKFASGEWNDFGLRTFNKPVTLSDCRDLVEVPGEPEWKLRCLAESFPQYCWKYSEPNVITDYHNSLAVTSSAPSNQPIATLPIFYACLPNSFSPYDFSVQPKSLDRARKRLYERMQAVYNIKNDFEVSSSHMCSGAACAVLVANREWLRAKIMKFSSGNDVLVDLVDNGNENIVKIQNLRPLLKAFGRLPPLAIRCRMKDVNMNDLTAEKVGAFQELIDDCGGIVRVEIADVSSTPFLVNLYHPTVQGNNLGMLFCPNKKPAEYDTTRQKQRNIQLPDRVDSEFNSDDTDEESICPRPNYVYHFERLQKPTDDEPLYISYIANSRFIYLHSKYHKKTIELLEKCLSEKWYELIPIPDKWLVQGVACAYFDNSNNTPYRVIIEDFEEMKIWIRSVDYGWKKKLLDANCLRLLTRSFSESPLMYLCRLPSSMQYHPHQSETDILRTILPEGTAVRIRCYRSKRSLPLKVDMYLETGESVLDILEQLKIEKRVLHPCFDLLPYRPPVYAWSSSQLDCDYREDLEIFYPFARGRLIYCDP